MQEIPEIRLPVRVLRELDTDALCTVGRIILSSPSEAGSFDDMQDPQDAYDVLRGSVDDFSLLDLDEEVMRAMSEDDDDMSLIYTVEANPIIGHIAETTVIPAKLLTPIDEEPAIPIVLLKTSIDDAEQYYGVEEIDEDDTDIYSSVTLNDYLHNGKPVYAARHKPSSRLLHPDSNDGVSNIQIVDAAAKSEEDAMVRIEYISQMLDDIAASLGITDLMIDSHSAAAKKLHIILVDFDNDFEILTRNNHKAGGFYVDARANTDALILIGTKEILTTDTAKTLFHEFGHHLSTVADRRIVDKQTDIHVLAEENANVEYSTYGFTNPEEFLAELCANLVYGTELHETAEGKRFYSTPTPDRIRNLRLIDAIFGVDKGTREAEHEAAQLHRLNVLADLIEPTYPKVAEHIRTEPDYS